MSLTLKEIKRYSRQLVLPDFGKKEQGMLKKARVAVIGSGGLGSPILTYLTLAGVGKIDIYDSDRLDITNLNRQFLYSSEDIGKPKARLAAMRLGEINPEVTVTGIVEKVDYDNAFDLLEGYDAVMDGTDNFPSRYALNDACIANSTPFFHGAVLAYEGRAMSIIPKETACYRCVFPKAPKKGAVPTTREVGVIGPIPGIIGTIQSLEAIRYLAGKKIGLKNSLLVVNADTMSFDKIKVARRKNCTACGKTSATR